MRIVIIENMITDWASCVVDDNNNTSCGTKRCYSALQRNIVSIGSNIQEKQSLLQFF